MAQHIPDSLHHAEHAAPKRSEAKRSDTGRAEAARFIACLAPLFVFAVGLLLLPAAASADLIILQSTEEVEGTVTSFDEDGVLMGKKLIGWGEILDGSVAKEQQPRFNKLLKDVGEDLFRIRSRLKTGDYRGALPHAENVYPRYTSRDSATAYMVFQALMWGRIATGQREAAVEPMLRCYGYLRSHDGDDGNLPGQRKLKYEKASGITPELQMAWLQPQAAKAALPGLVPVIRSLKPPTAGAYLYYATLAFAAGDSKAGSSVLALAKKLQTTAREKELVTIAGATDATLNGVSQAAIVTLTALLDDVSAENRPLNTYWLGYAESNREDTRQKQEGVLRMLTVPAVYGKQFPELSAAALNRAMQVLGATGDVQASVALRGELRSQYPTTAPALKLAAEKTSSKP